MESSDISRGELGWIFLLTPAGEGAVFLVALKELPPEGRSLLSRISSRREDARGVVECYYQRYLVTDVSVTFFEEGILPRDHATVRGVLAGQVSLDGLDYSVRRLWGYEFAISNAAMGDAF